MEVVEELEEDMSLEILELDELKAIAELDARLELGVFELDEVVLFWQPKLAGVSTKA